MVGYGLDKYIDMDGYEDEGRMQGQGRINIIRVWLIIAWEYEMEFKLVKAPNTVYI